MKRIRELIELAYQTGYTSARMECDPRYEHYEDQQRREIAQRNAARDALEADLVALLEAARLVLHDRDASDDNSRPVAMLDATIARFE